MNKTEMISAIADKTGLTKKDAEKALKAFTEYIRGKRESSKSGNQPSHPSAPYKRGFQVSQVQGRQGSEGRDQLIGAPFKESVDYNSPEYTLRAFLFWRRRE